MSSATETWKGLALPWQVAFEEAWASFRAGSFGVGAVLVDPAADNAIVTVGRNRVMQTQRAPRTLSGNMTAHAEMNAFAELDTFDAEGLHLYTTLEPCLMCAAAAMQLKVAHVHYAAADEFYAGMADLWASYPLTADRTPGSTMPLDGSLAAFARLLPMIFTLDQFPGRSAEQLARAEHPGLAELIDRLRGDTVWAEIRQSGTCHRALGHLWDDLAAIA
jgi:tRNA(Arg) A34 adenosine deaminase TadA